MLSPSLASCAWRDSSFALLLSSFDSCPLTAFPRASNCCTTAADCKRPRDACIALSSFVAPRMRSRSAVRFCDSAADPETASAVCRFTAKVAVASATLRLLRARGHRLSQPPHLEEPICYQGSANHRPRLLRRLVQLRIGPDKGAEAIRGDPEVFPRLAKEARYFPERATCWTPASSASAFCASSSTCGHSSAISANASRDGCLTHGVTHSFSMAIVTPF